MSTGGLFGAKIEALTDYIWVFNINGILLLSLFVATMVVYPYDPPMTTLLQELGVQAPGGSITMFTIAGRFN